MAAVAARRAPAPPPPPTRLRADARSEPPRGRPSCSLVHARPDTTARARADRPRLRARASCSSSPTAPVRTARRGRALRGGACGRRGADWDCEVLTDYADENLGLEAPRRDGLDWAFGQVDEAIVLEDDCLPAPELLPLLRRSCSSATATTRASSRSPATISRRGRQTPDASYFFSRYPLIWGWATWRARLASTYDPTLRRRGPSSATAAGSTELLRPTRRPCSTGRTSSASGSARNDAWDGAWLFASWLAGGLCAMPRRNLVTNVGFRDDATHTRTEHPRSLLRRAGRRARVPACVTPSRVERDAEADAFLEDVMFSGNVGRLFERIRGLTAGWFRGAISVRVVHVIQCLTRGGAGRALLALACGQGRREHDRLARPRRPADALARREQRGCGSSRPRAAPSRPRHSKRADVVVSPLLEHARAVRAPAGGLPPVRLAVWAHVAGDTAPQVVTRSVLELADVLPSRPTTPRRCRCSAAAAAPSLRA